MQIQNCAHSRCPWLREICPRQARVIGSSLCAVIIVGIANKCQSTDFPRYAKEYRRIITSRWIELLSMPLNSPNARKYNRPGWHSLMLQFCNNVETHTCMQTVTVLQSRFVVYESQRTHRVVCAVLYKQHTQDIHISLYDESLTETSPPILRRRMDVTMISVTRWSFIGRSFRWVASKCESSLQPELSV